MKVVGQVDQKFIAVTSNNILYLGDQHAIHERVRLEKLETTVLGPNLRSIHLSGIDFVKYILITYLFVFS